MLFDNIIPLLKSAYKCFDNANKQRIFNFISLIWLLFHRVKWERNIFHEWRTHEWDFLLCEMEWKLFSWRKLVSSFYYTLISKIYHMFDHRNLKGPQSFDTKLLFPSMFCWSSLLLTSKDLDIFDDVMKRARPAIFHQLKQEVLEMQKETINSGAKIFISF